MPTDTPAAPPAKARRAKAPAKARSAPAAGAAKAEGKALGLLGRAKTVRAPSRKTSPRATSAARAGTGAMLGAAAAGLAAGLAANLGRKAVAQAPSALAGDWLEAAKAEHRAALALLDALEATKEKATRTRATLLVQLKHALVKHALTEENVLYPVLREAGEKGAADKFNHEHGLVKDYLYQLGALPKDAPAFLARLGELRRELEAHIREEEESVFPALHARLSARKNKAVTQAANREGFLAA